MANNQKRSRFGAKLRKADPADAEPNRFDIGVEDGVLRTGLSVTVPVVWLIAAASVAAVVWAARQQPPETG